MRYVTTQTGFYTDPDLEQWSLQSMWLYRYLYENDHAHGISGTGRISKAVMLAETRLTGSEFESAKYEIGDKVKWYPDGTYWVVGRIKHTCYKNDGNPSPKHVDGLANRLQGLSPEIAKDVCDRYPFDTLLIRYQALLTEAVAVTESVNEAVAVEGPPPKPDEPSGQRPAAPTPIVRLLGDQFIAKAKSSVAPHTIYAAFLRMLDHHDEGTISAEIARCDAGDATWDISDRINKGDTGGLTDDQRKYIRFPDKKS